MLRHVFQQHRTQCEKRGVKGIRKAILPSSCPHVSKLNCGVLSLVGQVLLGEKAQGRKEKECGKEESRREHEIHPDPLILSHNFVGIRLNSPRDFPVVPLVKILPSIEGGAGSIPGQGAKFTHALWSKNQNVKQKQYCNKFNKDYKNAHIKNSLKIIFKNHTCNNI